MGHTGYISCARFIDGDARIVTASGDLSCMLWDIEKNSKLRDFKSHAGDVMAVAVCPDPKMFISGGCDSLCKLWDIRVGKCVQTFEGHSSDVNTVKVFPSGNAFASGSDDGSCRLFDIRAMQELACFAQSNSVKSVTSLDFSASGRFLFAGYDDFCCYAWDTVKNARVASLAGHGNRVSCLGVSADGMAVCTGSWDSLLKIWA